jgi:predicted dehydrogenase
MLRVGIIGLGGMGRGRLSYYAQMPDARVEAVADIRVEELRNDGTLTARLGRPADKLGWFEDYRHLVGSGAVDMVDICLPTYAHADAAVAALEGGLPALCEKPMALTLADCDRMLAASRKAGVPLMIAQCIRFWPEYDVLTNLVRSGQAGRLLSLHLTRQGAAPTAGWFSEAEHSGGAILDLHVHDIDYCQYLLGVPQRLYTQGGQSMDAQHGYDYVHTSLDYGRGPQVSVVAHWVGVPLPWSARYEARFERAFLSYHSGNKPALTVINQGGSEVPELSPHDAYYHEIRYFLDCVSAGLPLTRCPAEESRNAVALVQAEIASIERNALVNPREFTR